MRVIGLIGGMSWESSAEYYRVINTLTKTRLGPLNSAKSLMYTVDFAEVEALQHAGRWDEAAEILVDAAGRLERGGAECVVLCTNTMHKLADRIQAATPLPLIHIADATAAQVKAKGVRKVGLLGTAFTMEEALYKGRLEERFGLEVLIPDAPDRALVHRVIYNELCQGKIVPASKAEYVRVMQILVTQGAEGIILGCTEITLLVGEEDVSVPVFDTTRIHAVAAVTFALEKVAVETYV